MRSSLILAFLCVMGMAAAATAADSPPLILEHLTTADGLPQGTVFVTLQDSQGFVWLGTQDGLVRYDGHELLRYAYSPSARDGLPGNYIHQIVEDAHHDLWIAIKDAGVARWNRATDRFTVYRHNPANPGSLASDAVSRALLLDAEGRVWIGMSDAGIDVLDPTTGRIEHLRHAAAVTDSLISDRVQTLTLDRSGSLWVGTLDGLDRLQSGRRAFLHFPHEAGNPLTLSGNRISRIVEDRSGMLWIGTLDGGLNRMDRDGRIVEHYRHDAHHPTSLASDDVHTVLEDQAGHLWVGTSDGLDLLDRATGEFSHYRQDATDTESLRDSFIMSLYEDETGLVWIGTNSAGVSRWNPRSWELGGHRPDWLRDKLVTAFADAPDNKVWIGSLGGGLSRFDGDSGVTTSVDALTGQHDALGDQRVMSLRQDHQGTLWIGTMASGLKKLTAAGKLESVAVRPGDSHGLSAAGIMTIFESRSGQIWIGTHGGGANVLDPSTGLIRQLPFDAASAGAVSAANVSAIAEDRSGNLWIGTDGGGLDLARPDGTVVKVFRHDPRDLTTLPANTVYALAIDSRDRVWVATDGGGLARVLGAALSPESIRFQTIGREQGLSSDTIYGVLPDAGGGIWLSGNAGLMRYEPSSGAVKTYHREHGLQGEEYDFGAYFRLRDGRLCFGGPGGFNIFDPSRLTGSRQAPRIALTRVEVMGVPAPGPTPYWRLDRIALDYRANILSLDFGALDFTSPRRNRLAYRMVGLTDRWIDLGAQHRITLTNLESGDHVLEVRAANSDSAWSQTPLRLTLHRDPAPWRSPWAYTVYVLAALALIAHRVRLHRIKFKRILIERQRLESEVALRTRELVETNRQLEEAAQAKNNFLDRMSHELRTPMNGVVGMTELLARTRLSPTQSRLTQTIRSSSQVLLQIVNDLLDLSKISAGKVELEELPIELGRILEECTSLFAGAAESKGIDLIVCPPRSEPRNLVGDPLRVRQILMNLVGNAVKFTTRGEIVVRADVGLPEPAGMAVHFSVADTGIGMDADTIGRIFKPFTQADESTTRRFGGSGLGLAICRELADLMGGTVTVESRPQVGSTFHLSLRLQVGAEQPRRELTPLPHRRVRILTRRPALAESIARHVSAFGLTLAAEDDSGKRTTGTAGHPDELAIIDAGGAQDSLKTQVRDALQRWPALVVVATAAQVEAQGLESLVAAETIVLKPLRRDALHEALAAALGVAHPPSDAAATASVRGISLGGHVLLVEDEPVNAAVAQGYLAVLGCTSVWVKDGPEAVARTAAERFDLILMDLSMPTMDGFATTKLIRQRVGQAAGPRHGPGHESAPMSGPGSGDASDKQHRIPIVALTAHDAVTYRETCLQAGMDDVLSKPCTLEECARVLRRWIGRPDAPPEVAPTEREPSLQGGESLSRVDAAVVSRLQGLHGAGQTDLYARLVDLFQTGSSEAMTLLRAAFQVHDLKSAAALCHKLASSAANVGALSFAKDTRQLEQLCAAGDAAGAQPIFARLWTAHPALLDALLKSRLRAAG